MGSSSSTSNINHVFNGVWRSLKRSSGGSSGSYTIRFASARRRALSTGERGPSMRRGRSFNAPLGRSSMRPTSEGGSIRKPSRSYDQGLRSGNGSFPGQRDATSLRSIRACSPSRRRDAPTLRPGSTSTSRSHRPKARSPPLHRPSKSATITLPKGFALNECGRWQDLMLSGAGKIGFRHEAAQCPEDSKVGSCHLDLLRSPRRFRDTSISRTRSRATHRLT